MNFKVGDKVVRISNMGSQRELPIGSVWTVKVVKEDGELVLADDPAPTFTTRMPILFKLYTGISSKEDMEALYE
jgi:hypothetical protein